jgi:uncharacterized protein YkwD
MMIFRFLRFGCELIKNFNLESMKKLIYSSGFVILIIGLLTSPFPGQAQEMIGTPISNPDEGVPSLQYSGCGGMTVSPFNEEFELRVIDLVNQERAKHGLQTLKRSEKLTDAARYHAADMGQDNYFDHATMDRINGGLKVICDPFQRIATYYLGANGENAAAGFHSPEAVMEGWMNSDGHRSNILNPSTRAIGVGYYEGSGDYYSYWVQDFGTKVEESAHPVLGNLPEQLVFFYSIPDKKLYPPYQDFAPANTGTSDQLNWQVNNEGTFYSATPSNGTTPTSIQVIPDNFNQHKPGTYTGEITIDVTEPTNVEGAPYTLQIKLQVVDYKIRQLFLPGILK